MRRDTHNIFLSERTSVNTHRKRAPSQLSRHTRRTEAKARTRENPQSDGKSPATRTSLFLPALVAAAIVAIVLFMLRN